MDAGANQKVHKSKQRRPGFEPLSDFSECHFHMTVGDSKFQDM